MVRPVSVLLAVAIGAVCVQPAVHADGPPAPAPASPALSPTEIEWATSVVDAFATAKASKKPLFFAVNADKVDGKDRLEPAGKMLRETTYHDKDVVAKSREFVCVLVKADAAGAENDELRNRFQMTGVFVSPQHIFAYDDGTLISRKEYWEAKTPAASAATLISLMDGALASQKARASSAAAGAGANPQDQRAAWIRDTIAKVRAGSADKPARDAAIKALVSGDQKGDCLDPLCTAMLETKKDADTVVSILKAIGRNGLEIVVPAVVQLLDDKDDDVRSNAAVSLEYVGSARAIEPLTKRVGREKDELIANNVCRALGRCGAKQDAVRKTLVHEMNLAKSDRAMAGPAIGLSYFTKDAEAARAIEKLVAKEGLTWKRVFLLWSLAQIGDAKSADFVREKVQRTEKNTLALGFIMNVVSMLSGDEGGTAKTAVDGGLGYGIGAVGGIGGDARRGRDDAQAEFRCNGDLQLPGGAPAAPPGKGPPDKPGMGG